MEGGVTVSKVFYWDINLENSSDSFLSRGGVPLVGRLCEHSSGFVPK